MRMIKQILVVASALLLASCVQEKPLVPEVSPAESDGGNETSFVSAVSGRKYGVNTVKAGVVVVKFDEETVSEIERHKADVKALAAMTKSAEHPLSKVLPQGMERLFPHAGEFEARTREAGLHRWYILSLDENTTLPQAEELLSGAEGVEYVEFSPIVKANFDNRSAIALPVSMPMPSDAKYIFDDPNLPDQWHYYNDGSKKGMEAGCDIDVLSVWEDYTPGSSDVIVSVVDGGIDLNHDDLKDNLWQDPSTGQYGYNFVDGSSNIIPHDHGTHVAGTVAAVNNNKIGVAGVAGGDKGRGIPGVRLMSCQIFKTGADGKDIGGSGSRAIKWGADHGAVISQNSWGYDETVNEVYQQDREAIDYFVKNAGFDASGNQVGPMAGGVVIFAAGNDNRNIDSPSMYDGCISVAAVGADFQKAYYSNFGPWVDLCAPGGDSKKGFSVLSTLPNNSYGYMQGTSMACPHVSGVAALIVSNLGGPGFTAENLKNLLLNTLNDKVLSYNTQEIGAGMVSAKNCVSGDRAIEHLLAIEGANPVSMKAGKVREIPFSVKNPTGHKLEYMLTPQTEGVSVKANGIKGIIVSVDGPVVMKNDWKTDKTLNLKLSVTCSQEPDEIHSVDFQVDISANQAPYLINEMDGMVVDELGKSTKIALNKYFFDPDADDLTYDISESSLGKFKVDGGQVTFTADKYGQEEIEVTAADTFGEKHSAKFILLVRDGKTRSLDIYPNPVTDGNLYFRGSSKMDLEIKIYSASGKCVFQDTLESDPFAPAKVDMSALPGGTYTVKAKAGNGIDVTQNIAKI